MWWGVLRGCSIMPMWNALVVEVTGLYPVLVLLVTSGQASGWTFHFFCLSFLICDIRYLACAHSLPIFRSGSQSPVSSAQPIPHHCPSWTRAARCVFLSFPSFLMWALLSKTLRGKKEARKTLQVILKDHFSLGAGNVLNIIFVLCKPKSHLWRFNFHIVFTGLDKEVYT